MTARPALAWPTATAGSLAVHGLFIGAVLITLQSRPMLPQQSPESRIDISALEVPRETAAPVEAAGDTAAADAPQGEPVGQAALPPPTRVAAAPPPATAVAPQVAEAPAMRPVETAPAPLPTTAPAGETLAAAPPAGDALTAAPPPGEALAPVAAGTPPVAAAALPTSRAMASAAPATALAEVAPPAPALAPAALPADTAVAALPPPAQVVAADPPPAPVVAAAPAPSTPAPPVPPPAATAADAPRGQPGLPIPPPATPAGSLAANTLASAAPAVAAPAESLTAALAFLGGDATVDPVSLAAISAFMQPSDTSAQGAGLRDGLSALLASVPCARLQTAFDPATGALELRGHIPDPALRADLVARLSAQIGSAIPVSDRMQILPPPQCGTLAAMDAVGLPQSTEQDTNPRIVGPDTQIRDYRFLAGQRLVLDLTAPDYPAYVYADYFDAEGNVIHLQPNEIVPLAAAAPAEPLSIGRASPGHPALEITIAPPFGQEIAVAFAASRPVFDAPRPMVEPAAPYLDSLRDAIAAARRDDPDFKGEWVYFFVSTAAD